MARHRRPAPNDGHARLGAAELVDAPDVDQSSADDDARAVAELVASVVAEHGGEPDALEVIRPSLEDIYLRLVHAAGADAHDDEEALA